MVFCTFHLTHQFKCLLQFQAVLEQRNASKDVETKTCTTHGHNQTANIAQMTHSLGAHQRDEYVIILLTLILVNGGNLVRPTNERIVAAACIDNVAYKMLLAIVGR